MHIELFLILIGYCLTNIVMGVVMTYEIVKDIFIKKEKIGIKAILILYGIWLPLPIICLIYLSRINSI